MILSQSFEERVPDLPFCGLGPVLDFGEQLWLPAFKRQERNMSYEIRELDTQEIDDVSGGAVSLSDAAIVTFLCDADRRGAVAVVSGY
jgi:hypothetical protein